MQDQTTARHSQGLELRERVVTASAMTRRTTFNSAIATSFSAGLIELLLELTSGAEGAFNAGLNAMRQPRTKALSLDYGLALRLRSDSAFARDDSPW